MAKSKKIEAGGEESQAQASEGAKEVEVPSTVTLHYANSVRVDINGKVYEGTELTFATQALADEAKRILFEAHGVTPEA